jgi:hypothetical protein
MATKRCPACGETKPTTEYHRNRGTKDGLRAYCKSCHCEHARQYREDNREAVRERNRLRYMAIRDNIRETAAVRAREWYKNNRETALEYQRNYRDACIERCNARDALNHAIRSGKVSRPEQCEDCGNIERLDGHHDSYAEEHWLNVRWLCRGCHKRLHAAAQRVTPSVIAVA